MKKKNLLSLRLTIIIPVFNEEKTIKNLLDKIENQTYVKKQIILIDDKSGDDSLKIIENYKFKSEYKIFTHCKNKGKGACIKTAQKYVNGDLIVIQDADLEYDPADYKNLLYAFLNHRGNIIYGSRLLNRKFTKKNNFISLKRVLANKFLTLFSNLINNQKLTDAHTCYKMFKASIFKKIKLNENGFAFCPEITTKIANLNEKIYEVPINYSGRGFSAGKKIRFFDGIEALLSILKYRNFKK